MGALDRLEAFTSERGAARYKLTPNAGTVTLERCEPYRIEGEMGGVRVFDPGCEVGWQVA